VFDVEYKDQFIIWLSKEAKLKLGKKRIPKFILLYAIKKNKKQKKQENSLLHKLSSLYHNCRHSKCSSNKLSERERERELINNNATKLYKSSRTFCLVSNNTWHPEEEEEILQNISLHSGKKQLM
jgi:hypothetical protein